MQLQNRVGVSGGGGQGPVGAQPGCCACADTSSLNMQLSFWGADSGRYLKTDVHFLIYIFLT